MKHILSFVFLFSALSAYSQDVYLKENRMLAYLYQQKEYKLVDHEGDFLLLWSVSRVPKFVVNTIKGKAGEFREQSQVRIDELAALYPEFGMLEDKSNVVVKDYVTVREDQEPIHIEGRQRPFRVENLTKMIQAVMVDEYKTSGIVPEFGTVHKWGKGNRQGFQKFMFRLGGLSKLLIALSRGVTSRYMITGKEDELKEYLISRPMNSVNLEEMFRAGYRINNGDVYLTLLTIENVLSQFWTFPDRDKRLITTKLKDITNYHYKADKFGAWYHLFGIMLYGFAEGGHRSMVVGKLETVGGAIMSKFQDEWQEEYINSNAGRVGGRLRGFVKNKKYLKTEFNPEHLKEDFYMDLDEDFSARLEQARAKKESVLEVPGQRQGT